MTNNAARAMNIIKKGRRTRNQDKVGTPALQMRFRIQVHNRTTIILIMKMMNVLDT